MGSSGEGEKRAAKWLSDAGVHIESALSVLQMLSRDVGAWPPNNRVDTLATQLDIIGMAVDGLRRQVEASIAHHEQKGSGDGQP